MKTFADIALLAAEVAVIAAAFLITRRRMRRSPERRRKPDARVLRAYERDFKRGISVPEPQYRRQP